MTTNERIQELINLVNRYDCYIEYIDDYRQYKQAERANGNIEARFIEVCSELGMEVTSSDFHNVLWKSRYDTIEEAVNKLLQDKGFNKEETNMTTNTTPANNTNKEETKMITNTASKALDMVEHMKKGETTYKKSNLALVLLNINTVTERLMYVWDNVQHVTRTSDELYISKEDLAQFLFDADIIQRHLSKTELKKIKRQKLVDTLSTAVNNLIKAGVITPMKTVTFEEAEKIVAAMPPVKEHTHVAYGKTTSMDILEQVIRNANKNNDRNFISDWMLTSIISKIVTGNPLKGYEDGELVEYYKAFTEAQKDNINEIKAEFLRKSNFIPVKDKHDENKNSGYIIPAASLVYGRHIWLGYACVYRLKKDMNARYEVSLNGIKNTQTGETTLFTLENKATLFAKLDSEYVFIG